MILHSYSRMGNRLLSSLSIMTSSIFSKYNRDNFEDDELIIITCEKPINSKKISKFWNDIHGAWYDIHRSPKKSDIKNWRIICNYGKEIIHGLQVFCLQGSKKPVYFYLLNDEDVYLASDKLNNVFCILSAWQHLKRGKGFYHAAGVYKQNSAYLLVGVSGAGKTTTSNFSVEKGYRIFHDDHVVVYENKRGDFRVTDRTLSMEGVPLRAIFFLKQDTSNSLEKLTPIKTSQGLFGGSMDSVARMVLQGELLKNSLRISADIARHIPGYNLRFRKSPDFWDMIHNEV